MIRILFSVLLFSVSGIIFAQGDTAFNLLDKEGRRTGLWKSWYDNGKLRYTGYFKNGNPEGIMKRYYPGGAIQAEMNFLPDGKITRARLYNQEGKMIAQGRYADRLKDSVWNYYSPADGTLRRCESYKADKRNGLSLTYYPDGKTSEIIEWKDDLEHGRWEQYYENGDLRLKSAYSHGKRSGPFESFYPGNIRSITGEYRDGLMHGRWTYFNEKGETDLSVEYVNGEMLPNEEYEKRAYEFARKIEEAIGNFRELDDIVPE